MHWPDYYSNAPGGHEYGRSLMCELFDINELGEWKDKVGSFSAFRMPVNSWEFVNLTLAKRTWKGKAAALLRLAGRMAADKFTGKRRVGSGNAMQGRMLQAALREKIPIRLGTAMTGLIVEGGRVTGITVAGPDGEKKIEARHGVLLNTGGFSHNLAMRQPISPLRLRLIGPWRTRATPARRYRWRGSRRRCRSDARGVVDARVGCSPTAATPGFTCRVNPASPTSSSSTSMGPWPRPS